MDFGTLTGLYRQYLGRDPEPGAEAWLQYDDGTIVNGIANSEEANNFRNQQQQQQQQPAPPPPQEQAPAPSGTDRNTIAQLYRQYLGRDPEPGAYDYWGSRNYNDIVQGITNSAEYAQRLSGQQQAKVEQAGLPSYPAPTGKDTQTQQVVDLYQTFLGRNPDPESLANDVNLLRRDPTAYGWLVDNVANSPEAKKAAEAGRTNIADSQAAQNELIGKYGYTYPRTSSGGGLYGVINTIIGVGTAVIASFAAPEIGAAILAELGADAATISSYATAVGNAATAGGTSAINNAMAEKNLGEVIKAASTAAGTAGVSAGAGQAIGSNLPGGLPSSVAGGVTGAGVGTLSSLIQGKDPLTGAVRGFIPGAVGGGIRDLSGAFTSYDPTDIGEPVYDPVTGRELSPQEVAAMYPDVYPGGVLPSPGQETQYNPDGTVRYVSPGADIAARTGATLAGGLMNYLYPTTTPSGIPGTKKTTSTSTTKPTSTTASTTGTPTKSTGATYILGSPSVVGTGGPGSQALSQVLNLGSPTSAYSDTGATGEDISKETGGKPRNVWNIESLRVKDETGS